MIMTMNSVMMDGGRLVMESLYSLHSLKTIARAFPAACCGVSEHNNRKTLSLSF
jgi:hypothetical protein